MNTVDSKIALGTVQFGLPYGVSNTSGQVTSEEVSKIINFARLNQITTLDTASDYGTSQTVLGKNGVADFKIISKISLPSKHDQDIRKWVQNVFQNALNQLQVNKLYGFLLHRPEILLGSDSEVIFDSLMELKIKGLVDKIGISVYSTDELDLIFRRFKFDLVQAPFNILDRTLYTSGWMDKLSGLGVEIHVRSAFLQGLLLFSAEERPKKFDRWNSLWSSWHKFLEVESISPLEACLLFLKSYEKLDKIIVGVENQNQLAMILKAYLNSKKLVFPTELYATDKDLIHPSRWNLI